MSKQFLVYYVMKSSSGRITPFIKNIPFTDSNLFFTNKCRDRVKKSVICNVNPTVNSNLYSIMYFFFTKWQNIKQSYEWKLKIYFPATRSCIIKTDKQWRTHVHERPHVQHEVVSRHVPFPSGVEKVLTQLNAGFQYMFYYVLRNAFYFAGASRCRQAKPVPAPAAAVYCFNNNKLWLHLYCSPCLAETRVQTTTRSCYFFIKVLF